MSDYTFGLTVNEEELNLDTMVKNLSVYPNTFTVAFFECGRPK